jgi:hypothetical protein
MRRFPKKTNYVFVYIRGVEQSIASAPLNRLVDLDCTNENPEKNLDDMPIAVKGTTNVLAEHFKIVSSIRATKEQHGRPSTRERMP